MNAPRIPSWKAYKHLFAAAAATTKGKNPNSLADELKADAQNRDVVFNKCTYSPRSLLAWQADPASVKHPRVPKGEKPRHLHLWLSERLKEPKYAPYLAAIAPRSDRSPTTDKPAELPEHSIRENMRKKASGKTIPKSSSAKTGISERLKANLLALNLNPEIRAGIDVLLQDSIYPTRMVLNGSLVKNPIWNTTWISKHKRNQLIRDYSISDLSAPSIEYRDLFLIKGIDDHGHGKLYTYFSRDWNGYLIPNRQRLGTEETKQLPELNARRLENFITVPANALAVKPIADKYVISVKPHALNEDLILYIFEFNSVTIDVPADKVINVFRELGHGGDRSPGRWHYMQELRNDPKLMKVNADVIWAINTMFSVTLEHLPTSLPEGFVL
jgi:hypothetical protein